MHTDEKSTLASVSKWNSGKVNSEYNFMITRCMPVMNSPIEVFMSNCNIRIEYQNRITNAYIKYSKTEYHNKMIDVNIKY